MTELEKAIEELKFEYSMSKGQRASKAAIVAFAGVVMSAVVGNVFNMSVKAIRNHKASQ